MWRLLATAVLSLLTLLPAAVSADPGLNPELHNPNDDHAANTPPSPPTDDNLPPILVALDLNLNGGENNPAISTSILVRQGETSHDAVLNFGLKHNVDAESLINLKRQLDRRALRTSPELRNQVCTHPISTHDVLPPSVLLKKGRNEVLKGFFKKAGRNFLHAVSPDPDLEVPYFDDEIKTHLNTVIKGLHLLTELDRFECGHSPIQNGPVKSRTSYMEVLTKLREIAPKSGDFPLKVAECYAQTQQFSLALQTTAAVLSATGSKGRWKNEQSRTKAGTAKRYIFLNPFD